MLKAGSTVFPFKFYTNWKADYRSSKIAFIVLHGRSSRSIKIKKGHTETRYQKCPIAMTDPGIRINE